MSLSQQQQQQFNSHSQKAFNTNIIHNESQSSQERMNMIGGNPNVQKQQVLLFTPNNQNNQKVLTPQQQISLQSANANGYSNPVQYQSNNNGNTANMKFQKNLNNLAFNNSNNQQPIIHHQNNFSNNSESLSSELRSFFQDNSSGMNSQLMGTIPTNKNTNNNNYASIIQSSKNGSIYSNQHRLSVMTPSTNADEKSILSLTNNFASNNPKQVDLSISSQSQLQNLMQSQLHSKSVSQTTQMSAFNTSGEVSQFNYSSLGNHPIQFGSGNISSVITNINLDSDSLSATLPQNLSISTINNSSNTTRCRFHPCKKVYSHQLPHYDKQQNFQLQVKYQMSKNENEKFCTACAVEYAKQGFDVETIIKVQQKEIDQYMNDMLSVKGLNDLLMNSLDSKQLYIKEHCRKQSQLMQDLFLQIEKVIYEHKTQLLSQINNKMWESINDIELKKNETRLFEQKLLLKQQDIEKNYQQVTTQMGISEVREILYFYNQELDQIRSSINGVFKNTSFELATFNQNHISQQISILKKFIQEEIFKPQTMHTYLSETMNVSPNQRNSPSKNDKNQLSRFMTNQEKKGSGKKQQQQQTIQQQNQSLVQQLQNYQIQQSQQQPQSQQSISELNGMMNKQKQYLNEQIANNTLQKEQQIYITQIQQKQAQLQYNEINDTSISEKQHTQESDDLSSVQGMYQNMQNQSKISNKSNISSHKIINYSDIHDEPNLNLLKEQSSPAGVSTAKQTTQIRDSKTTPIPQEKKSLFPFQCISPQQTSKNDNIYRQQFSTNKENQLGQKQRQIIQTEPTHLPSNKMKQGVTKQGNYQRNLMMNDDIAFSNNKFKLSQTPISNFNLINHFNKQNNQNSSNLSNISPNSNKTQEQAHNQQHKVVPINSIRQLQLNLVDQDSNQKSLTSRAINNSNGQNSTGSYINSLSQNQSTNIVAQLIQQKQQQLQQLQQNTLKNGNNFQQIANNEFTNQSSIKN